MPFQVSPGVAITEKDLTTVIPNISTTIGGIVIRGEWGPCNERVRIESENELVKLFGQPKDNNFEYFWPAANYLAYSNNLLVVRAIDTTDAKNGAVGTIANSTSVLAENADSYDVGVAGNVFSDQLFVAKFPGTKGDSLKVLAIDSLGWEVAVAKASNDRTPDERLFLANFNSAPATSYDVAQNNGWDGITTDFIEYTPDPGNDTTVFVDGDTITQGTATGTVVAISGVTYDENSTFVAYTPVSGTFTTTDGVIVSNNSTPKTITATKVVKNSPVTQNNDELHILVLDEDGKFSNVAGEILEVWSFLSKAKDAKRQDGSSNYVSQVLRNESNYVYLGKSPVLTSTSTDSGSEVDAGVNKSGVVFKRFPGIIGGSLLGGNDGTDTTSVQEISAYNLFSNPDVVDVTLMIAGGSASADTVVGKHIIQNIADVRKDCVAIVSPQKSSVVGRTSNDDIVERLIADKSALGASNYGVMDSAWKYQYDRYRDIFVNVPMNGDIAGLMARTDYNQDPWFSPAGFSRGTIKNIVKPTWEPSRTDRDELYKISINPLVSQTGSGVVLFGDKTMQLIPSAFDRINVRRLFIILEKAIAVAAKQMLFEFNDTFTRSQFVNIIAPFLREVQGRRGITDFKIVCDETNNTGQIIDTNNFVGDIFVKPTRSINFVQLNFVAARSDVSFSEIGG